MDKIFVKKEVTVTIIEMTVLKGTLDLTDVYLINEIKEWAFFESQAHGVKAGSLTEIFDQDDSDLDFGNFQISVVFY